MDSPVTLLLVDDQTIMLDGLEALLALEPGMRVLGRATNGRDAIDRANELKPDVVLMDISMPVMDGIEATRAIVKAMPDCKVLVLTMYKNKESIRELLDAGATGYVLKNAGRAELREAVITVAAGRTFLPDEINEVLARTERWEHDRTRGYQALSKREREVLAHIARGLTSQEIADKLFLSPQTIDTHRKNIMHKLNARHAAELVKYALERGWEV